MPTKQKPHPVDVHVGEKIRQMRKMRDKTQQQLAGEVGIRFQQIQKYETAKNRVSASRLWDIAIALDVHVKSFFEGMDYDQAKIQKDGKPVDILNDNEALDLVRFYFKIPEAQRRGLFALMRAIAKDVK
jgi:transcriptional regulator with XRE-family HTH domain